MWRKVQLIRSNSPPYQSRQDRKAGDVPRRNVTECVTDKEGEELTNQKTTQTCRLRGHGTWGGGKTYCHKPVPTHPIGGTASIAGYTRPTLYLQYRPLHGCHRNSTHPRSKRNQHAAVSKLRQVLLTQAPAPVPVGRRPGRTAALACDWG